MGVPCIFYKITGLMCPGCGVSRLCMALIRLDFYGAFKANSAIFCLIPLWTIVFGVQAVRYVRYGSKKLKGWQDLSLYFSAVVLVAYGVIRNISML